LAVRRVATQIFYSGYILPYAKLRSIYCKKGLRSHHLALGFGKLGAGEVANLPFVTEVVCTELELEPEPRTPAAPGHIDLDGEVVSFGPVRVSVRQGPPPPHTSHTPHHQSIHSRERGRERGRTPTWCCCQRGQCGRAGARAGHVAAHAGGGVPARRCSRVIDEGRLT
jgi:hypothetical protein